MPERPDLARRGFLSGALLTSAGRREVERRTQPLGPLPPAVHVSGDPEACRDCVGPCVDACGQRIVRRHDDRHASPGLPFLEFTAGSCTFCGDCVDACPACPSDLEGTRVPARVGLANIDAERCVAFQGVICASCRLACDPRAVRVDAARRPFIEPQSCTGCGACVGVCPVEAVLVRPMELGDPEGQTSVR